MIFTALRLFRLRRFRQQASQRCHSFLPRASMSPCHKMFHFTPRLAPNFPWLRRLYHVAAQSRLLFSLKQAGLAWFGNKSRTVGWCDAIVHWDLTFAWWHPNLLPRDLESCKPRVGSEAPWSSGQLHSRYLAVTRKHSQSKPILLLATRNTSYVHHAKACAPYQSTSVLPLIQGHHTGASTQSAAMPQSFLRNHRNMWMDSELTISRSPRGSETAW